MTSLNYENMSYADIQYVHGGGLQSQLEVFPPSDDVPNAFNVARHVGIKEA